MCVCPVGSFSFVCSFHFFFFFFNHNQVCSVVLWLQCFQVERLQHLLLHLGVIVVQLAHWALHILANRLAQRLLVVLQLDQRPQCRCSISTGLPIWPALGALRAKWFANLPNSSATCAVLASSTCGIVCGRERVGAKAGAVRARLQRSSPGCSSGRQLVRRGLGVPLERPLGARVLSEERNDDASEARRDKNDVAGAGSLRKRGSTALVTRAAPNTFTS
jgi:hypothetical protein